MAYIDGQLKEGTLVNDLKALILANGWTFEKSFKKVTYPSNLALVNSGYQADSPVDFDIAEHHIFKSASGLYYGIAKTSKYTEVYGTLPNKPYTTPDNEKLLRQYIAGKYKPFGKECNLFFYMLDKVPAVADGGVIGHGHNTYGAAIIRTVIDVEVYDGSLVGTGSGAVYQTISDPDTFQSPFVKSTLRNSNLTGTNVDSNWWPDSVVRVKGFIDSETLFIVLQADNTPAFQNNVVPSVPIYWGKFESFKVGDTGNHALWAGTAFDTGNESASHQFDQKDPTPYRRVADYLPLEKTYPNYPGNGIDNIIVKRSELGSRYQAYFLSWNTAPQTMPPDRVGKDGGQYPLSWTTQDNDEYKYKFNPSMYSQKIHTSRAYLVHPDEGVRGYLPRMVILAPLGLVNDDKLKVRTNSCPDEFDIYRFFLTSAISPVSKRPGTAFTPAGIGIYEKSI